MYTKRWAADLALDFAGCTADRDLAGRRAVEPSCGAGAFLEPMVERLAQSCFAHGHNLLDTGDAIRAWDLDPNAVAAARASARNVLLRHQVEQLAADRLADRWIRQADYLLATHEPADWVIGNPPYVRSENVLADRMTAYRARWNTMTGRADIYIGFSKQASSPLRTAEP